MPSKGRKSGVEMWPAVVEAARPRLPQPTPRTVRSRCSSTCPWQRPWRPPRWGCTCSCQAFRQRDEQVGSHLRPHSHRWPSQTHWSELSGQQVGSPTQLSSGPYDRIFVADLFLSPILQSMMNAKLISKQWFWHCHENRLVKAIQTIPLNSNYLSVSS